ncbi:MAG TPA: helix-turn-helix domain-containing protein [Chlamydiales bacterium]|nr:helix-turn-helix domain-containing protein [Chlamydiales bacterium]
MQKRSKKHNSKSKLFEGLKESLEEIIAYKKGKITLRSELIDIPEPPEDYKPKDIKRIREESRYSQGIFARVLNVSIKTVQAWESGERIPSHAALRLLEVVDKGFYRPKIHRKTASL